MSVWRRKVLELFPDLREEMQEKESIYLVFSDLVDRCLRAHERDDRETLRKIYGFAEWCATQDEKELWNPAGVSFYEHVIDSAVARKEFPHWVSRKVFEDVASLIEARMGPKVVAEMRASYETGAA